MDPKNIEWKLYIADQYRHHQQFEKALHHLQDAKKRDYKNFSTYLALGQIYLEMEDR